MIHRYDNAYLSTADMYNLDTTWCRMIEDHSNIRFTILYLPRNLERISQPQIKSHLRMSTPKLGHLARQRIKRKAVEGRYPHMPSMGSTQLIDFVDSTSCFQFRSPGMGYEDFTRRARNHAARTPFKQLDTKLLFDLYDLTADC